MEKVQSPAEAQKTKEEVKRREHQQKANRRRLQRKDRQNMGREPATEKKTGRQVKVKKPAPSRQLSHIERREWSIE